MTAKFLIKITFWLLASIGSLFFLNIYILQGGLWVDKSGIIPKRTRFSALAYEYTNPKPAINISTTELTITSKSQNSFFKKGEEIAVKCVIKNTSNQNAENVLSLIRTHEKEIVSARTEKLQPDEQITLENFLIPEKTGMVYLACRSDIDNQIEEAEENDNSRIGAIFVIE